MPKKLKNHAGARVQVALACFTPLQFDLLKLAAEDKSDIHATHAEWRADLEKTKQSVEEMGHVVLEVQIDIPSWVDWCKQQGLPLDGKSRSKYASYLAQREQAMLW